MIVISDFMKIDLDAVTLRLVCGWFSVVRKEMNLVLLIDNDVALFEMMFDW